MIENVANRETIRKTDLARLRTYIGVPKEVKDLERIQFEKSKSYKRLIKIYNHGRT